MQYSAKASGGKKKSNQAFKINEQIGICDTTVAGVTDISNSVSTTGFE